MISKWSNVPWEVFVFLPCAVVLSKETHGTVGFGDSANYPIICCCMKVGVDEAAKTKTAETLKRAVGIVPMVL